MPETRIFRLQKEQWGERLMQWTVGKVRITQIIEGETIGSTRFILPQVGPDEVHALVVETPTQRIVVDTCLGNDKQGRSVPTWNNLHTPFLENMTAAGFAPDSIDTVLCTHLHVDHVGWNTKLVDGQWVPTFAKARYVFGRDEYNYWAAHSDTASHLAVFNDSVKPIADAGLMDLVASDAQLSDEITLIPTPGHSPGPVSYTHLTLPTNREV